MPGQQPEQIAVRQCSQHLRPVAEVVQAGGREDPSPVFVSQAVERCQGKAISAIKALKGFKQLGFSLVVGGLCVPGSGLRLLLRAYNFVDSHGLRPAPTWELTSYSFSISARPK